MPGPPVGESGCGKSTLARVLLMLERPDRGHVRFEGTDPFALRGKELGCRFRTRCWKAEDVCAREAPPLMAPAGEPAHAAACHFPLQDAAAR
ncbi:ATP-binding cassette domain-containing protein [Nonomuraea montanisoli]|uniref:ATP-binding cassette domain-containing protein n=1 Tax=Nonomuraea montanisoli TaxID=2741721 RepID=UPI0019665DCE|nr:ATP-binding cassette domain-containing protein [Nonomuraea montanisoli]